LENHLSSRKHGKAHDDPRRCRLGFPGGCPEKPCRNSTFRDRVLSRAFSEELDSLIHAGSSLYFDPRGHLINLWHKIFLTACLLSLFVDPMFLYLTGTQQNMCVEFKYSLGLTLSMIRSLMDLLYAVHILIRFRTAFIARVRQRGARHPASQDRQEVPFEDILVGSRHRAATATGSVCFSRPRACSFAKCSVNKQYV
jgi:hypothetical protein